MNEMKLLKYLVRGVLSFLVFVWLITFPLALTVWGHSGRLLSPLTFNPNPLWTLLSLILVFGLMEFLMWYSSRKEISNKRDENYDA